jgi:hypothetical protein
MQVNVSNAGQFLRIRSSKSVKFTIYDDIAQELHCSTVGFSITHRLWQALESMLLSLEDNETAKSDATYIGTSRATR